MAKIEDIFVDREDAMHYLEEQLEKRRGKAYEEAIRITQAPGTGKTRLLKEFIRKIELEERGVGIYIRCPEIENWYLESTENFRKSLRRVVLAPRIKELAGKNIYLSRREAEELMKKNRITGYLAYENLLDTFENYKTFVGILKDFAATIPRNINRPLVIAFDEIQATIGQMREQFKNHKQQGLFREIIKLVSDLISLPNVMVILSGTNYKIIHFLEHLGSPLYEKTNEYTLEPLIPKYVGEFYDRIFGVPKNETEQQLRTWLITNSNGVPRTMVWMAEELQNQGGTKWVHEIGLPKAIETLDDKMVSRVRSELRRVYNDLSNLKNGRNMLEFLVFRSMFSREIYYEEFTYVPPTEADKKNYCSVDDLINKGLVHLMDSYVEIRNVYYEKALRDILKLDSYTLLEIMRLLDVDARELTGLLSWQRTMLGPYLEIAVAIGLFKLSKALGKIDLNSFFDRSYGSKLEFRVDGIIRVPSFDAILTQLGAGSNIVYASPERGPDLTIITEDKKLVLVECKNWQKKLPLSVFKKTYEKLKRYASLLGKYEPIYVLITANEIDEQIYEFVRKESVFFIKEETLGKIVGEKVLKFFTQAREQVRDTKIIAVNID